MLLHKKCTFLGLVLMLLGIIVARFVIVSPNAVFDYFFLFMLLGYIVCYGFDYTF